VPSSVRAIVVLSLLAVISPAGVAPAQSDAPPPDTPAPPSAAPSPTTPEVREVAPATYYVKDENGKLVRVLNLTLPELHRLLRLDLEQADSSAHLPSYTLQELQIRGKAEGNRSHLTVTASIRLLTENWVRVPLRLGNTVLREQPKYEGEAEVVITSEEAGEGYVCWFRGAEGQFCSLTLELAAAIEQVGNEFRFDLQSPRATSSTLEFEVPVENAMATVSNGLLEVVDTEKATRFLVAGIGGDFRLTWREGDLRPANPRPLLEANVEQLVKVDGVRQVTADLRIKVSSLRGEFDAFTVRLPIGAKLFPRQFNQSGLQVAELPDASSTGAKLVQVKLDRATMAAVEAQLLIEYVPAANGKSVEYDLGGLDVEDAFRQSGTIDFVVKNDLKMTWKPVAGAQRTFVPEALRSKVFARFEITRRSYSLLMQVSPKDTQVSVEPTYQIHVARRQIQLDATLKYRIRGANLYGLNVQLSGWQVTQVRPDAAIDAEALDTSKIDPLFIPLSAAGMTDSGELTLQLSAVYPLAEDSDGFRVTLPRPEAKTLAPATVVITLADNLELTISDEESRGLERDPFPPTLELPEGQRRPLFYRESSEAAASLLVAQLDVRPRSVSVSAESEVKLDSRTARVTQTFKYRVAYEPLRRLQFVVSRNLLDGGDLRFVYQQQALPMVELDATSPEKAPLEESGDQPWVRIEVDPLGELYGTQEIAVQHSHSLLDIGTGQETPLAIPLVQPWLGDGTIATGNTMDVQSGADMSVRADDDRWEAREAVVAGGLSFASDAFPPVLSLQVSRRDVRRQTSTVVSQTWIETRLGESIRRERAVFRISTNAGHVAVQLPEAAKLQRLGRDGGDVTDYVTRDQQTRLIDVSPGQEHVLELWYEMPAPSRWLATIDLDVPKVVEAQSNQRVFWTLITPPNVHLLSPPGGLTPELTWQWRGFFWGRVSRLQPQELERWIGAAPQAGRLPETSNHYLFSSFGTLDRERFTLAARGTLLVTMSGVSLAIGLLLIYVRGLRHPAAIFVGGLVVFTLILWYPGLAAELSQASAIGLLLALVACLLKWFVDLRQARGSVIQGTTYASPDSQTVKAAVSTPDSKAVPATTVPASMAVAESKA